MRTSYHLTCRRGNGPRAIRSSSYFPTITSRSEPRCLVRKSSETARSAAPGPNAASSAATKAPWCP
ncbi:hypothetical protein DPMN_098861 [Dreissena polymorpha]|uniref:Uncharacterized protein n=1 Tax=Dreissena polymorpha TaxID=45954 RepID=A0A9D4R5W6_DREPO|nr:hypothetical protein DPMN_098861 [Dreissena polymorpha]